MASITGSPEQIATILQKGMAADMEKLIKQKLLDEIDPIISDLARDLAKKTSVAIQSYVHGPNPADPFGTKVQVRLVFNNKEIDYTAESK
jgi:hypothetical protein